MVTIVLTVAKNIERRRYPMCSTIVETIDGAHPTRTDWSVYPRNRKRSISVLCRISIYSLLSSSTLCDILVWISIWLVPSDVFRRKHHHWTIDYRGKHFKRFFRAWIKVNNFLSEISRQTASICSLINGDRYNDVALVDAGASTACTLALTAKTTR